MKRICDTPSPESGGIVLAVNTGSRVPSGGVTLKRRCTYRPSVIYLIVNKLFSPSPSLSTFLNFSLSLLGLAPTEAVARRSKAERPRKQAPPGPADQVAESRI